MASYDGSAGSTVRLLLESFLKVASFALSDVSRYRAIYQEGTYVGWFSTRSIVASSHRTVDCSFGFSLVVLDRKLQLRSAVSFVPLAFGTKLWTSSNRARPFTCEGVGVQETNERQPISQGDF